MAASPDYYVTLGVSPTAGQHQIREAYKRAALKSHPDRVAHNDPSRPARTQKFQLINDAYFTLSDPERRRAYDATRSASASTSVPTDSQFADVFEEMMAEEGLNSSSSPSSPNQSSVWSLLGGLSGATIGFIVGNVPGLVAGAVAGNRLGAVRDAKGKSVYEVFQALPQSDKAKLLSELAAKVLAHAVS